MDDLRRLVRDLRLSARAAEQRLGVSGAQLFVLQQLQLSPASSMAELAARTLTDQSSVSVVVARLKKRGLVARHRAPLDRRRVEIALTPAGRALIRRAPLPAQSRLATALQRMTKAELARVGDGLHLLAVKAGISGERPALFFEKENG